MKSILIFILLSLSTLYAQTNNPEILSPKEDPAYIKVSEITTQSIGILSEIKELTILTDEKESLVNLQKELLPYCDSIAIMTSEEKYKKLDSQNIRNLQKMHAEVSLYTKQLEEWDDEISEHIGLYDKSLESLKTETKLWEETKNNAIKEDAPSALVERSTFVLDSLNTLHKNAKIKYDKLLTSSQLAVTKILFLKELQKELKSTENLVTNRVFYQNQAPLLEVLSEDSFAPLGYLGSIKKSIVDKYSQSKDYVLTNSDHWLAYIVSSLLTLIFVFYYNYLYRKKRLFVSKNSLNRNIFFFIAKPFSTLFLLSLLLVVFNFPDRPPFLMEILLSLSIVPIIRVLQTVIQKEYVKFIYAPLIIYLMFLLEKSSVGFELESRIVMLMISTGLIVYLVDVIRKKVLFYVSSAKFIKYGHLLLYLAVGVLFIAIVANFYGTMLLSTRIVKGVMGTIYSAMIFYTLYVILTGYIVVMLRRRIATASYMLEKYSQNIEKTTRFLIKSWMLLWWLLLVVKMLSIYPFLVDGAEYVMSLSWQVSETNISVSIILDFIFIVVGTWVLARLVRTVLEVEVFARFKLPRGAPTAILTTLNYVIIITGTIVAFSSLGVSPQQFALIFGALGVGIGFGLRNIIANFISGIIMVFERPIQIGDTIEVDKTMGKVQSIGARSSTVKTFDGSEVIIPNADFIAKEIVNWTLSDEYRRKIVEFKVDLDNDIEVILTLMKEVAIAHPDVLKDPEPLATLKNFGEYYLEFKLYFWLHDNLIVAHSDVNIAIYKALKEANIKMPVPRTDVKQLS